MTFFESSARSILLFERDLFGKPVPTFPDHALEPFFDRFLAANRFPPRDLVRGHASLENALLSSPSGTGSHASRRPGHVRDPLVPRIHRRASRHRCRDRPAPAESGSPEGCWRGRSWRYPWEYPGARGTAAPAPPMTFQAAVAALAQAWEWERAWGSAPQSEPVRRWRPKPENCPARPGA